jgi:hypothetical protein
MTDPQEASDNVTQLANSDGATRTSQEGPKRGQSVGGPATATESTTEAALTGSNDPTVADMPADGDQARNPL